MTYSSGSTPERFFWQGFRRDPALAAPGHLIQTSASTYFVCPQQQPPSGGLLAMITSGFITANSRAHISLSWISSYFQNALRVCFLRLSAWYSRRPEVARQAKRAQQNGLIQNSVLVTVATSHLSERFPLCHPRGPSHGHAIHFPSP